MTAPLQKALEAIHREDFVLPTYRAYAYRDEPLPIGYGQTISQPSTVAFMLRELQVRKGQRVLDIGAGSGWTTALLAYLVGSEGFVLGTERVAELVTFGQNNLAKYQLPQAKIMQAGVCLGAPEEGPYDRILVSAAADSLPDELLQQLKPGGIMVAPVQEALVQVTKTASSYQTKTREGFRFVPLITEAP